MKRTIRPTTLVIAFATVLVLGIVPNVQAGEGQECSNATLYGSFGVTITGTVFDVPPPLAGPFAQVARQTFDGEGHTEGTATTSLNGNIISQQSLPGTYTVNADCTGSITLTPTPPGITVHADFVIDDDGKEFRAVVSDPGSAVTVVGRKQFPRGRKEQ